MVAADLSLEEQKLVEIEGEVEALLAIARHIFAYGSPAESARAGERVKSYELALTMLRRPSTDGRARTVTP